MGEGRGRAASGVVPDNRSVRRGWPTGQTDRAVSGGSCGAGAELRCGACPAQRGAAASAAAMGCLLAGLPCVGSLRLDDFWSPRLPASPEGTGWLDVLKTLVAYRLINPGGERRLHRQWYERSAVGDLLGADFALAHKDNLYRCLDKLLLHKTDLFASCNNAGRACSRRTSKSCSMT
jgi:hypothetical protein